MNWVQRMYEIKGRDLYSQNGESLLLEYLLTVLPFNVGNPSASVLDLGSGDGFYLSNTRHLENVLDSEVYRYDRETGQNVTLETVDNFPKYCGVVSIDIDGNDYWILDRIFTLWSSVKKSNHGEYWPYIVIAEFNPAFTDSRTIKYNPDHEWAGDDYYGFSFDAGMKLADKHGYKVIFNVANMNLIMVRKDLIEGLTVPPVTYEVNKFFKESGRPESDWVKI